MTLCSLLPHHTKQEMVPDTVSIDSLKRNHPSVNGDLVKFFVHRFGSPGSKTYRRAQMNFVESMVR